LFFVDYSDGTETIQLFTPDLKWRGTEGDSEWDSHRNWTLPIYGHPLIADLGPIRGERSDLVKVLKEPLPDGIPRMPRFRQGMNPADIKFIQDWIDADCPEV
jgi:hypothetical protein